MTSRRLVVIFLGVLGYINFFLLPYYPQLISFFPALLWLNWCKNRVKLWLLLSVAGLLILAMYYVFEQLSPVGQYNLTESIYRIALISLLALTSALFFQSFQQDEPVITKMAKVIRQHHMPIEVVNYTRKLTAIWGGLLAVLALVNCLILINFWVLNQPPTHYAFNAGIMLIFFILELFFRKFYLRESTSLRYFFHAIWHNFWQR